jgi:nitroimidazol reductase NimA-like FMN-containing flavoprotein (pyridoxamine 5'-phosphate oxidase superfamily)
MNKIRRIDRQETSIEFLHDLLEKSMSCTVAISTEPFPLIHATFFAFNKSSNEIIFHFSKHGLAAKEITEGRNIAISIYKFGRLYTAEKAVDFGGEYQSVIIYGSIRIVEKDEEKMDSMRIFFDKFFSETPKTDYKEFTLTETNPIYIIKVKIDKWLGKQHLTPDKAKISFYSSLTASM